jgi:acyl-CoA synthetase (AMP-forming)/AMP-acid ligase II
VTCLKPGEPQRIDARGNVSCGRPFPGVEVRIAPPVLELFDDPAPAHPGTGKPAGGAGEILVRGPGVFAGYFDAEESSREALRDGWLHTGDLGALDDDGHLFVFGRQRAMLKRGGLPLAPREVEEAAEWVTGVRAAAAVGLLPAAAAATEEIAVALEADAAWVGPLSHLAAAAATAIEAALGFAPESILVLAPQSIPRTANGKVRHGALRRDLIAGDLERRGAILFDSRRPLLEAFAR